MQIALWRPYARRRMRRGGRGPVVTTQPRMDAGGVAFCAAGMMCVCLWLLGADDGYNGMMRKVVLATAASRALLAAVLCGVSRPG